MKRKTKSEKEPSDGDSQVEPDTANHPKPTSSNGFQPRTSILNQEEWSALYNLAVVAIFILLTSRLLHNGVTLRRFYVDMDLVVLNTSSLPEVLLVWLGMLSISILAFFWLRTWDHSPPRLMHSALPVLGVFGLLVLVLVPPICVFSFHLPSVPSILLLMEQIRFLMKIWSFCAEKLNSSSVYSFRSYLYFLFAPTLLYRDHYPRCGTRRWSFVAKHLCEILILFIALLVLLETQLLPPMRQLSTRKLPLLEVLGVVCSGTFPWSALLLGGAAFILHSIQNLFAEILCFPDRQFYLDWWNSTDFRKLWRTWNIIVHHFLVKHVFKPLQGTRMTQAWRNFPTYCVFMVSAVVHEYILAVSLGYFFPFIIIHFGFISAWLTVHVPLKRFPTFSNMFIGFAMILFGPGCASQLYALEYYTRQHCPSAMDSSLLDFFIPRLLYCYS